MFKFYGSLFFTKARFFSSLSMSQVDFFIIWKILKQQKLWVKNLIGLCDENNDFFVVVDMFVFS